MTLHIYNLEHKPTGKQKGDTVLALVHLTPTGIKVECYDEKLKTTIEELFAKPIIKRSSTDIKKGCLIHYNEEIAPYTEDFFREIVYYLHKYGLYGELAAEGK